MKPYLCRPSAYRSLAHKVDVAAGLGHFGPCLVFGGESSLKARSFTLRKSPKLRTKAFVCKHVILCESCRLPFCACVCPGARWASYAGTIFAQ